MLAADAIQPLGDILRDRQVVAAHTYDGALDRRVRDRQFTGAHHRLPQEEQEIPEVSARELNEPAGTSHGIRTKKPY